MSKNVIKLKSLSKAMITLFVLLLVKYSVLVSVLIIYIILSLLLEVKQKLKFFNQSEEDWGYIKIKRNLLL